MAELSRHNSLLFPNLQQMQKVSHFQYFDCIELHLLLCFFFMEKLVSEMNEIFSPQTVKLDIAYAQTRLAFEAHTPAHRATTRSSLVVTRYVLYSSVIPAAPGKASPFEAAARKSFLQPHSFLSPNFFDLIFRIMAPQTN